MMKVKNKLSNKKYIKIKAPNRILNGFSLSFIKPYYFKTIYFYLLNILFFFLLLTTGPSSLTYAGPGKPYNKIVLFGDSLTDNGNLFKWDLGILPKNPPYFQGRFSNGYIWADKLTLPKKNIAIENLAVGGETAILHNPTKGYLPLCLSESVDYYLIRSTLRDRANSLFFIWIGANDYLSLEKNKEQVNPEKLTTEIVSHIKNEIEKLIHQNATNFAILNLPDIADTPYGNSLTIKPLLHLISMLHNLKLQESISQIQNSYKQVNIQLIDVNALFAWSLNETEKMNKKYNINIKNVKDACWRGGLTLANKRQNALYIQSKLEMDIQRRLKSKKDNINIDFSSIKILDTNWFSQYIKNSPSLEEAFNVNQIASDGVMPCQHPEEYLFWDTVHPTTVIQEVLAKRISELVNSTFTPL